MRIAVGTIIAQKYRLEGQVARGGMGAVWAARHMKLGSLLAIKFLDAKLAASPALRPDLPDGHAVQWVGAARHPARVLRPA